MTTSCPLCDHICTHAPQAVPMVNPDNCIPGAWPSNVMPMRQVKPEFQPIELLDGAILDVRLIQPSDEQALFEFHEGLSERTKFERFHGAHSHLSQSQVHYFTHVDNTTRVALVALSQPDAQIVAVARYDILPKLPYAAELAIVVTDAYQSRGVATALTERLLTYGQAHGVKEIRGSMLHYNIRVHSLLMDVANSMGLEVVQREKADNDYDEDEVAVIL